MLTGVSGPFVGWTAVAGFSWMTTGDASKHGRRKKRLKRGGKSMVGLDCTVLWKGLMQRYCIIRSAFLYHGLECPKVRRRSKSLQQDWPNNISRALSGCRVQNTFIHQSVSLRNGIMSNRQTYHISAGIETSHQRM